LKLHKQNSDVILLLWLAVIHVSCWCCSLDTVCWSFDCQPSMIQLSQLPLLTILSDAVHWTVVLEFDW